MSICCHQILSKNNIPPGAPNSAKFRGGGVAEGQPRFDKVGVANFFLLFTR